MRDIHTQIPTTPDYTFVYSKLFVGVQRFDNRNK